MSGLFETAPQLVHRFSAFLTERFPDLLDSESQISKSLTSVGETLRSKGGEVLNTVLTSAASVVNAVVLLVLVPVITFYLLIDWDRMVARINELVAAGSCADNPKPGAGYRQDAGLVHSWSGHGLPDPGHILCGGADAGRIAVRAGGWSIGRFSDLHSLCRGTGRRRHGDRAGIVPVLGGVDLDCGGCGGSSFLASSWRAMS